MEPFHSTKGYFTVEIGSLDYKNILQKNWFKNWFFKERFTERFIGEPKLVLLCHCCENTPCQPLFLRM